MNINNSVKSKSKVLEYDSDEESDEIERKLDSEEEVEK